MAQRRLAAILAADVAGYSRLMEADEEGTHGFLKSILRELIEPGLTSHRGTLIKTTGDGVLAEFASAVDAVRCAMELQKAIAVRNAARPTDKRAELRIGVNVGDIIADEGDIFGDAVNIASRIEGLAEPGGLCVSGAAYDHVQGKLDLAFEDIGPQSVKNIARPIQVLRVRPKEKSDDKAEVSAPVPGFQGRPAIAVLPLQNMSGDPEQEYFADGIAEDILTRLAMWRWCPIIARNSSFAYKGKNVDIRRIGKELGARYVLEGSVRKSGDRVRITVQLLEAETGHHVWAERYDRKIDDIFALQDEIVDAITAALQPAVGQAEIKRARRKPPTSLDAWDLCLRGIAAISQVSQTGVAAARDLFHQALALDPECGPACSGLASTGIVETLFAWTPDPQKTMADALGFARKAVALDPLDADARRALCYAYLFSQQPAEAVAEGRSAINANPSHAMARHALGVALMSNGQHIEAIESLSHAIRLSPNDPWMFEMLGALASVYYVARDYATAAEKAKGAIRLAPQYPIGHRVLAAACAQLGRQDEAKSALAKFLELTPGYTVESARRSVPFREEADFQLWLEGLRKAGWQG